MRRAPRRRARRSPWQGTLRLAAVFAVLVAVNVYFFFFRRGTSLNDLVRLSEDQELAATVLPSKIAAHAASPVPATPKAAAPPHAELPDDGRPQLGTVDAGH